MAIKKDTTKQVKKAAAPKKIAVAKPVSDGKVSSIASKAMLVRLSVSRWHPHATDHKVGEEVATQHNSDVTMGKYRKRLLPKEVFDPLRAVENRLRREHEFLTLPWMDGGQRILSQMGYMKYVETMNTLKADFDKEWRAFIPQYEAHKAAAKARMNSLFNEADYPPVSELMHKFGVKIRVEPIHSGSDFRVDIGDTETARIRQEIEEDVKATIDEAIKSVWSRLQKVVLHASERLKAYNVNADGKVENTFRESLVTNIIELLEVIPALNITGDPNITKFATDIKAGLTLHSATVLKDDEKIRKTVADTADDILKKMEAFI